MSCILVTPFLLLPWIARAYSVGQVRAKDPEFTATININLYDVKRRMIDTDNIGKPWIYRQPDRPDAVLLGWESSDLVNATVLEMSGLQPITIKFWGRNKAGRKVSLVSAGLKVMAPNVQMSV